MRKIIISCFILLLLLGLIFVIMGAACEENGANIIYFAPGWTSDSRVLYVVGQHSYQLISGRRRYDDWSEHVSSLGYPKPFTADTELWDVTGSTPYIMVYRPTANSTAYGGDCGDCGGYERAYRKIVIRNTETATIEKEIVSCGVESLDWSSDGNSIVYVQGDYLRIINVDAGTDDLIVTVPGLEYVSWKFGSRIAFVREDSGDKVLSLINSDGSGQIDFSVADSVDQPQISSANNNWIYGVNAGGDLVKLDVSSPSAPVMTTIKTDFDGLRPRISPDGTMLIYSRSAFADEVIGVYDLDSTGVYILHLADGREETYYAGEGDS